MPRTEPLRRFVQKLKLKLEGARPRCHQRPHASLLEDTNGKTPITQRSAYGLRDAESCILKAWRAFTGKPRRNKSPCNHHSNAPCSWVEFDSKRHLPSNHTTQACRATIPLPSWRSVAARLRRTPP